MALKVVGHIELPENRGPGGFDHADIHYPTNRLYVAHTGNDGLDIIDTAKDRYVETMSGLRGVAGALVSHERGLVFSSNRGEDTVSIFSPGREADAVKVAVGKKPNGLAIAPTQGVLMAANVGDPSIARSHTVSVIDVQRRQRIGEIEVPGRTRWAVFDAERNRFFVNIAAPARIVAIDVASPDRIAASFDIPIAGPHGLDLDTATRRLLCACDAGVLVAVDANSGQPAGEVALSGVPDVVFLHPDLRRLYVAIGDPGVIDVIDIDRMERVETVKTEAGAHTFALDRRNRKLYVFLPHSHRAAVFCDD